MPQSLGYELIGDTQLGRWLKEKLLQLAKQERINVEYGDTGRASGYYVPSTHTIRLSSSHASADEECMVFLHEVIHAFRHAKGFKYTRERRDDAEVIVEGTAFMVAAFYGLEVDNYSFTYIAS
ncbi:zinc metallopeptidase [Aneurinibacillus migulanus]|uniref:Putative neutral zinc metallopeptidase n=1 Tax=Aneurinibacillus migulanus TaxID=47500 RepID=A0A0D1VJT2_ANEMI|nr:zinc metallopeptidase [Aneurinibacillus migulanus]KIV59794.1 hypothetical protein TS65_02310 [Aneurinibacillus migulanus]KON84196.1 hypothetical protein AF333_30060 [Aneurinibacillus migulanus]MED0890848.1 zinc metallopeptidase [Aneurinibacillus migulanus]MED1618417.1 zinc metallopeptidase [Aneurinibacillus migulanus]SDJ80968.1 Putative neutral zinc metallopeptidase [Aneurinibacillus migulanus]